MTEVIIDKFMTGYQKTDQVLCDVADEKYEFKQFFGETYCQVGAIINLVKPPPNTIFKFLLHPKRSVNTFSLKMGQRSD